MLATYNRVALRLCEAKTAGDLRFRQRRASESAETGRERYSSSEYSTYREGERAVTRVPLRDSFYRRKDDSPRQRLVLWIFISRDETVKRLARGSRAAPCVPCDRSHDRRLITRCR